MANYNSWIPWSTNVFWRNQLQWSWHNSSSDWSSNYTIQIISWSGLPRFHINRNNRTSLFVQIIRRELLTHIPQFSSYWNRLTYDDKDAFHLHLNLKTTTSDHLSSLCALTIFPMECSVYDLFEYSDWDISAQIIAVHRTRSDSRTTSFTFDNQLG